MKIRRNVLVALPLFLALFSPFFVTGCAIPHRRMETREPAQTTDSTPPALPREASSDALSQKIEVLESKIDGLNAKLEALRTQKASEMELAEAPSRPSDSYGTPVTPPSSPTDPEAGFLNEPALQDFRKAMVLFQAQKYPETILSLTDFIQKNPDHLLAAAAQYYRGESYLRQKDYPSAIREFEKFLSHSDRDAHVSDALKGIVMAYEELKDTVNASKHRQLLTSLFPHSPAASQLENWKSESSKQETLGNEALRNETQATPPPTQLTQSPPPAESPLPSSKLDVPPTAPLSENTGRD